MKKVILSNGGYALVDDSDFQGLDHWKWRRDQHGYATRVKTYWDKDRKRHGCRTTFMHRQILNPVSGYDTDHIDGNRLNNARSNLRVATRSQNNINRGQLAGISWHKQAGKWRAYISKDGKQIALGLFDEIELAISARLTAEHDFYGEFVHG